MNERFKQKKKETTQAEDENKPKQQQSIPLFCDQDKVQEQNKNTSQATKSFEIFKTCLLITKPMPMHYIQKQLFT